MRLVIEVTLTDAGAKAATSEPDFSNRMEKIVRDAFRDADGVSVARAVTVKARR